MKKIFLIPFFLFFTSILFSQGKFEIGFIRYESIPVLDISGNPYKFPWVGGMNNMQFNSMDLNFDGYKDLVAFDKHGNRLLTFINNGIPNTISYTHAPEYALKFPIINSWMQLIDYNGDGLEDIYCLSPAGISLYNNVSDTVNGLKFQLETLIINSLQGSFMLNIYAFEGEYPGIVDIDRDGDFDILAFWGLGSILNFHKNFSMELYGHPKSLSYKLVDNCWGKFSETPDGKLLMNQSCGSKYMPMSTKGKPKHAGATMLFIDLDGDLDYELLLGDADTKNLAKLTNGGTPDSAYIISIDTLFPLYTKTIELASMPQPFYLDVNNDGKKDLVVSPFDGSYYGKAENFKNVWYYKNIGTTNQPVFNFVTEDLFVSDMIDVGSASMPVLFDYDNDGLLDLFIGNYGYRDTTYIVGLNLTSEFVSKIALFKNTGTKSQPSFRLITRDFGNVSALKLNDVRPTFGDLDGDGDADMLIGEFKGNIHYYQNNAGPGNPMNVALHTINYKGINVGRNSTPELISLTNNRLDLIIGEKLSIWEDQFGNRITQKGGLNYYKNIGSKSNPNFILLTDSFGNVDVTDNYIYSEQGYTVPAFYKNPDDSLRLVVGSASGRIYFYTNLENNFTSSFTQDMNLKFKDHYDSTYYGVLFHLGSDSSKIFFNEGYRCAPAIGDLNNDGYPDMILGNFSGGLSFFKGISGPTHGVGISDYKNSKGFSVEIFPNPANNVLNIIFENQTLNHDYQVLIKDLTGRVHLTKTISSQLTFPLNIDNLKNGFYLCQIIKLEKHGFEREMIIKKFIVNK